MKKLLVANRGEIAVRVIRTCREMGVGTVAVYSQCDRKALHVRLADEAYAIGPDKASESYLRIDKVIDVARRSGADGIHPGYGFLAENPAFAEACAEAGLTFVGPGAAAMRAMGSKTAARELAAGAGVPIVPGGDDPEAVGYPLLVKAVGGGGGKGMRVVREPAELERAVQMARSEARSSFGDDRIYFERLLERPRHVEVQLLGDRHGAILPFVERECSIQRRHQKLIEETPSPSVTPDLRERLMAAAAAIGRAAGYTSAGTVEFLVDAAGAFYFLEVNTRLQVEHPVTEAVTGVDFVRAQIEIAEGGRVPAVESGSASGHAIEVRVYAENPDAGFLPSPGSIVRLRPAGGAGIREDSGVYEGWTVPPAYDALLSKVVAWAPDRPGAIARMVRALTEYDIRGIRTTVGFCRELVASPAFAAAAFDTTYVDRLLEEKGSRGAGEDGMEETAAIAAALWAWKSAVSKAGASDSVAPSAAVSGFSRTHRTPLDSLWARRARLESLR